MEKFVTRDEINFKLEPEYLQELAVNDKIKTERNVAIDDKIKKEISETESEETITPNNAGQIKLEHDEISIKSLSCHICNSKLKSKVGLKQHMNIHTRERLFKCSECNKEFTQQSTLNGHLKTHSKERLKLSCILCDKKLTTRSRLTQHVNNHTRETLYKCSVCTKKFTEKRYLKSHLNTHLKVKLQFSCKLCNKKFETENGLKKHINKHTRERLYKCSECNREFTQKQHLKSHLNIHSKKRLRKTSQTSSEKSGDLLSNVEGKSMNKCTTALSKIIKSETMGLVETDLNEYITTAQTELNIDENESSCLPYSTCYNETICKEEIMLPDEND